MDSFIEFIGAILLLVLRIMFAWVWRIGNRSLAPNNFFYRIGKMIVSIFSLGLLKAETPDNVKPLDWHTVPEWLCEWIGFLFCLFAVWLALDFLLSIVI